MNLEQQDNKFFNNLNLNIPTFHKYILDSLRKSFNSSNIYYKPSINGDIPDIVILEEDKGVILIDICTIKLSEYRIKDKNTFISINTNELILSPIKKLSNFKNNLFNLTFAPKPKHFLRNILQYSDNTH